MQSSNTWGAHERPWTAQQVLIASAAISREHALGFGPDHLTPVGELGRIMGTVTDVRGVAVPDATVILMDPDAIGKPS